jgi:hypothetical protein
LVVLPFAAKTFLYHEPMVAGAWMGLAVKTDGAAVAAGAITDALIRVKAIDRKPGERVRIGRLAAVYVTCLFGFIIWVSCTFFPVP